MNVDLFLKRIVFLAKTFGNYDVKDIVKLCLMDMDMPTDWDGFKYLVYGIAFCYENPDALITKHVYPAIAKEFNCQSTSVEIAIRRAIEAICKHDNKKLLTYFSENRRMTNSEFISAMVEMLKFWDTCRKNLVAKGVGERD